MGEEGKVLPRTPQPDKIAINGFSSLQMLNKGSQSNILIPVEAQRYEHLLGIRNKAISCNEIQTILIVGDISIYNSDFMVREIADQHYFFNGRYKLIYKPHPAVLRHHKKINKLNYDVSNEDIRNLLNVTDIVICSTYTSVAVDARYLGIPVINFLNQNDFNMSPFRGSKSEFNADNGLDILKLVSRFEKERIKQFEGKNYFWLSDEYKLWIEALKND
jgi:surface carbohydrate biosynthesis protein (TIGR04326 family)